MMKRKILAVVLPIVGCATVVGSGFSAWYFGDAVMSNDDSSFGVQIGVTEEVAKDSASLTVKEDNDVPTYLILDQGGQQNKNNPNSGIMFAKSKDVTEVKQTTADWAFSFTYDGGETTTIQNVYQAGMQIRFEIVISFTEELAIYVGLQDNAAFTVTSTEDTGVTGDTASKKFTQIPNSTSFKAEYIVKGDNLNLTEATYNFKIDLSTTGVSAPESGADDYSNALLKYKYKPTDSANYKVMHDGLEADDKLDFKVVGYIEDNPNK